MFDWIRKLVGGKPRSNSVAPNLTSSQAFDQTATGAEPPYRSLQYQLLDDLFQDDKQRIIHWESEFGDIVFQEIVGNRTLYRIVLIEWHDNTADKSHRLHFAHFNIGETKSDLDAFLAGKSKHQKLAELWDNASTRHGRDRELRDKLPKGPDEVYVGETSPYRNSVEETNHKQDRTNFYNWAIRQNDWGKRIFSNHQFSHLVDNDPVLTKDIYVSLNARGDGADWNKYRCLHAISLSGIPKPDLDGQIAQNVFLGSVHVYGLFRHVSPDFFEAVFSLPHLVDLSLERNEQNTALPIGISKLTTLRYLSLGGPWVMDHHELGALTKLRTLSIFEAHLADTSWLSSLQDLEELVLVGCKLGGFPKEIRGLANLKAFDLTGTDLPELPIWIDELSGLESLKLEKCGLTELPSEIVQLENLRVLNLKKNPFGALPKTLNKVPKRTLQLEIRHQAKFDPKAAKKIAGFPTGTHKFAADFNLKLLIIDQLMYVDCVLLPKFDVNEFAEEHGIDIEAVGYDPIPEVEQYFRDLEIPLELCLDIVALEPDGASEVFGQIWPFWGGEEIESFLIKDLHDLEYLPRLKTLNNLCLDKDMVKAVRARKIKVPSF